MTTVGLTNDNQSIEIKEKKTNRNSLFSFISTIDVFILPYRMIYTHHLSTMKYYNRLLILMFYVSIRIYIRMREICNELYSIKEKRISPWRRLSVCLKLRFIFMMIVFKWWWWCKRLKRLFIFWWEKKKH